jgi:FkbM family methyltransferase
MILPHLRKIIAQSPFAGLITLHETALGQRPGQATFTVVPLALGMSGLQQRHDLPSHLQDAIQKIEVRVDTLDSIISPASPVRFIKLDVEGGEFHALLGGFELVRRARPMIVFENGRGQSAMDYGYPSEDFFKLFENLDYDIFDALGFPFGPEQWSLGSVPWQFVALPREDQESAGVMRAAIAATLEVHGLEHLNAEATE